MNEQELYIPYEELQDVSTGNTPGVYFVKTSDGNALRLQFVDGRLDEASEQVKQSTDEAVQHTIELLEKKLTDEEVKSIEDEAAADDDDETKQPFDPSSIKIEKRVVTKAGGRYATPNEMKHSPTSRRSSMWVLTA